MAKNMMIITAMTITKNAATNPPTAAYKAWPSADPSDFSSITRDGRGNDIEGNLEFIFVLEGSRYETESTVVLRDRSVEEEEVLLLVNSSTIGRRTLPARI